MIHIEECEVVEKYEFFVLEDSEGSEVLSVGKDGCEDKQMAIIVLGNMVAAYNTGFKHGADTGHRALQGAFRHLINAAPPLE